MADDFNPLRPYVRIRLIGEEQEFPTLLDISSFLYDFNLLYEIARLATDPKYGDFRFTNYVYYRSGRPLQPSDRLRISRLVHGSPLEVVSAVTIAGGALGAIWLLVQIAEKLINVPLNRRKLKAEVEKLERDNQDEKTQPLPEDPEQARSLLRIREAEHFYDNVSGRLERSTVRIREIEIEIIFPEDGNQQKEV